MSPLRGWEPEVPADDTITRAATLSLAHRVETVGRASGRRWHRDDRVAVVSTGGKGMSGGNGVVISPLDRTSLDAIAETLDSAESAWFFSPWDDGALADIGFELGGHPPFMTMWPETATPPRDNNDVVVDEATTAEELAVAERILIEGYPVPEAAGAPPGLAFPPGIAGSDMHVFVARIGGDPVGVAAATVAAGVHQVEFVATLERARGAGVGALVTWAAATVDPMLPAVLVASDLGRPVYRRLGFQPLSRWAFWMRP